MSQIPMSWFDYFFSCFLPGLGEILAALGLVPIRLAPALFLNPLIPSSLLDTRTHL